MRHRHNGQVVYRTRRGRVAIRRKPIHSLSRPKIRRRDWYLGSDVNVTRKYDDEDAGSYQYRYIHPGREENMLFED